MISVDELTDLRTDMKYTRDSIDALSTKIDTLHDTIGSHAQKIWQLEFMQKKQADEIKEAVEGYKSEISSLKNAPSERLMKFKNIVMTIGSTAVVYTVVMEVFKHLGAIDKLIQ
jgi:predicted  nucleic acid-binding Zn-ribbon protein